jgi:SAM-dependent methyltransferase
VLTARLAERCDELDALDASGRAIELARQRLEHLGHVRLRHVVLPAAWSFPDGSLDLVVVSEIGYFLAANELDDLLRRAWSALRPGGHLLLCHWLGPIVGWPLDGEEVHRAARRLAGDPIVEHREEKFLLEVFEQPGPGA